jgi:transcriptional regulator with XRE-family HTH domain
MTARHPSLHVLGANIRKNRQHLKLRQIDLAQKAKLDPTYISGIERGVRNPSTMSLARIAKALGSTVADLCQGIDQ